MKTPLNTLALTRRHFVSAFLTLGAFVALRRGTKLPAPSSDKTVIAGQWVLKKSDLS